MAKISTAIEKLILRVLDFVWSEILLPRSAPAIPPTVKSIAGVNNT